MTLVVALPAMAEAIGARMRAIPERILAILARRAPPSGGPAGGPAGAEALRVAEDADRDPESRTEEATPKKLEDLRKRGVLGKSGELTAAVSLAVGAGVLVNRVGVASGALRAAAAGCFSLHGHTQPLTALGTMGSCFASILFPVACASLVAAAATGLAQTRGYFSTEQLGRNFEQLAPESALGRILPGKDVAIEVGKMITKVLAVGLVVGLGLRGALPRLGLLARLPVTAAVDEVRDVAGGVLLRAMAALLLLGVVDFALARRRFGNEARMTRQEVKDEHKDSEGDPKIRAKRKARAAKLARQRAISDVKKATVLVVNPTHIAIALRYDRLKDAAPLVLAKGQDELALRMRDEARRCRVPIVENRPLARAMHASAKVGRTVPVELYEAVARVIAHVMRIQGALPAVPAGGAS